MLTHTVRPFCRALLSALAVVLLRLATGASSAVAQGGALANLPAVPPVQECGRLAAADISAQVGATTHIRSAEAVPGATPAPYCRVTGYVEPAIQFEVHLPLTTWTQRYVQTGCGGLCGNLNVRLSGDAGCLPAQNGEVAVASTDMGHSNGGSDGDFGKQGQLRVDFAYRAEHVTALASKALIRLYYGQAPKFSYFAGCSDGGREALMEAQRYPGDFNGITAGAAAMNFVTQNTFYHGWNAITVAGAGATPVLTAEMLPVLHKAALDQCDAADGVKDGLISEPLACHVDTSVTVCGAGQTTGCLSRESAAAAAAIYAGAHDAAGNRFVLSGPLPGSELAWAGVYVPRASGEGNTMSPGIALGVLKNLAYVQSQPDTYKLTDFQFTPASFAATTQLHALYDSTDPDLTTFQKAGGKLILWHGYADPHISPLNSIAYYTAMQGVMGKPTVDGFARLYLFPGGYHCAGGEGPFTFGVLNAIMAWVEKGAAPNAMLATHSTGGPGGPGPGGPGGARRPAGGNPDMAIGAPAGADGASGPRRAAPGKVDRTRPVYPYPYTAKYNGTGDVNDAASFSQGDSKPVPAAMLVWAGSAFYKPHYEQWCTGKGAELNCSARPQ